MATVRVPKVAPSTWAQHTPQINWGVAQSVGLAFHATLGEQNDTGAHDAVAALHQSAGIIHAGISAAGPARFRTDATSNLSFGFFDRYKIGTGPFTCAVYGLLDTGSTLYNAISNNTAAGRASQWRIVTNYNGTASASGHLTFLTFGSSAISQVSVAAGIEPEKPHWYFAVRNADGVLQIWRDSVLLVESSALTIRDVSGSVTDPISVGWATSNSTGRGVSRASLWTRALRFADFEALTRQPDLLTQPRKIWVPVTVSAGGGAQSVSITQPSETDAAQPVVAFGAFTAAIGQASETNSAQAVTAVRALTQAVGQAAETDTAQSVTTNLTGTLAIGQATETDTAQPVSSSGATVQAIGQASETDAAQPMAAALSLTVAIGQAQETDSAQSASPVVGGSTLIGQASETDTAQALAVVPGALTVAIGQAAESDAAQAMAAQAVATITAGLALEIDTAQAFTTITGGASVAIWQVTETDLAQAITASASGGTSSAADVWNYVLSNGKTAEETAVETHAMLTALTAILGADVAPGINTLQGLRIILAAVSGPTTGIGTDTERYYSPDGATARITATFDALGNRQSVTLDPS